MLLLAADALLLAAKTAMKTTSRIRDRFFMFYQQGDYNIRTRRKQAPGAIRPGEGPVRIVDPVASFIKLSGYKF